MQQVYFKPCIDKQNGTDFEKKSDQKRNKNTGKSINYQYWSYPMCKLVLPRESGIVKETTEESKKINQEIISPNVFLIHKKCVCVLMDELILPNADQEDTLKQQIDKRKRQKIFYIARISKPLYQQYTIERDDCIDVMKEGFFYYFIRETSFSTSRTGNNIKTKHTLRLIDEPQPKNVEFIDYTKHLSEKVVIKNGVEAKTKGSSGTIDTENEKLLDQYTLKEKDMVYNLDLGIKESPYNNLNQQQIEYEINGFEYESKVYTDMVTQQIDQSNQYSYTNQIRTGGKSKEQIRKLKSTEFYFMNDETGIPQLYEVIYIKHVKQKKAKSGDDKVEESGIVNQNNFEEVYRQILSDESKKQIETIRSQLYNKEYEHERVLLQISHFKTRQESLRIEWVNPKNAQIPLADFDLRPNYKFNFYWKFGEGASCKHQSLKIKSKSRATKSTKDQSTLYYNAMNVVDTLTNKRFRVVKKNVFH
jgi:hypothetical protein